MKKILATLGSICALTVTAHAQDSAQATINLVSDCSDSVGGMVAQPEVPCACAAGVIAGNMSEAHYNLLGRLVPTLGSEAAAAAEIAQVLSEGVYTEADLEAMSESMAQTPAHVSRVCSVLEQQAVLVSVSLNKEDWPSVTGIDRPAIQSEFVNYWSQDNTGKVANLLEASQD